MTIDDRLAIARRSLADAGIAERDAAMDVGVLASQALGCDRAQLVVRLRDEEPPGFADRFEAMAARRASREPLAYILGEREFWGLPFEVNGLVLIPRPETELIVEEVLDLFRGRAPRAIADVCTGSGCLAVALATEFPDSSLVATDISGDALAVARRNAARNGVAARIAFNEADFLQGVTVRADVIVSNPPYVASGDAPALVPEVRDHEPHVALFGGSDGLHCYHRLLPDAVAHLEPDGFVIVEVGYDQDDRVAAIAAQYGLRLSHVRQDLQGITRTLVFVSRSP